MIVNPALDTDSPLTANIPFSIFRLHFSLLNSCVFLHAVSSTRWYRP